MLDSIPVDRITAWDADFQEHLSSQQGALLEEISKGVMTKELEEKIKTTVKNHVSGFLEA